MNFNKLNANTKGENLMSDMTEQERKKRLAESLLRGERTVVNSSGRVETAEEARENSEQTITVPQGKMA